MRFQVISSIEDIRIIAVGRGIRMLAVLKRQYGHAHWAKKKGLARVRLEDGTIHRAELHWYEASGIGRRRIKIKRLVDL